MTDKRAELLEYIRTLYERQSSRASKAGMTYWAILAGLIYVVWHMLKLLSDFSPSVFDLSNLRHTYSAVHIVILSIIAIINLGKPSYIKNRLDYRVSANETVTLKTFILILSIYIIPLCINYKESKFVSSNTFFYIQQSINYWSMLIISILIIVTFVSIKIRESRKLLPTVGEFIPIGASFIGKLISFVVLVLFIELLIGNLSMIAFNGLDGNTKLHMLTIAFDLSLIFFGFLLLNLKGNTDDRLSRLSSLERDVIIHNLPENEIMERLQEELLGSYLGDSIEKLLKKMRDKSEQLIFHIDKAEDLFQEIRKIDINFEYEKEGRVKKYVSELESLFNSYDENVSQLLKWLNEAKLHASLHKNQFVSLLIESSKKYVEKKHREIATKFRETFKTGTDLTRSEH